MATLALNIVRSNTERAVCHSFKTTADNYLVAWESLINQFDNKKELVHTHVKAIYESESINYECAVKLGQFIDGKFNEHMQALEPLGWISNEWKWLPLLIHVIMTKLDKSTLRKWTIKADSTEVETPSKFITFLETQVIQNARIC